MNCKKEYNVNKCNCSYNCSRKGVCCDCLSYHRSYGELPACYFPNEFEKRYDRSIEYFISLYQANKIKF